VLSIFTIPKPFVGHIEVIQRNAIRSWLALRPSCEITLFGNERGTADCASQLGLRHVPDLKRNEYGTPLLDDAFRQAEETAGFPHLCYVNTDIILPVALTEAVKRIPFPVFLMTGQRMEVDVDTELDFGDPGHALAVESQLRAKGWLLPPMGTDYFVFTKGAFGELPPFVVGRPGWDNWMVFRARQLHLPVVDATSQLLSYHQNHDYSHVPGASGSSWEGPEADSNRALAGPLAVEFTRKSATWRLTADGLIRYHWWNRGPVTIVTELAAFHPWARPLVPMVRALSNARAKLRAAWRGGK
jgi:hypothetical protein